MQLSEEELLAKAKKLALQCKKEGRRGLCSIGGLSAFGEEKSHFNAPCHAPLNHWWNELKGKKDFIRYVVDGIYDWGAFWRKEEREDLSLFLNYFINSSPYACIYVTKSADEILDGGVVVDAHHPSNLVAGGMIFMRMLSEEKWMIEGWIAMFKAGVDPTLALYLCTLIVETGDGIQFTNSATGHRPLDPRHFSKPDIKRFLSGRYLKGRANEELSSGCRYDGVHSLWNGANGSTKGRDFIFSVIKADHEVAKTGWGARGGDMVKCFKKETYAATIASYQEELLIELGVKDV